MMGGGSGGYGPPPAPPSGGGGGNTALWVVLGVLVLAAIGGLVFFLTSGDDDEDGDSATGNRDRTEQGGDSGSTGSGPEGSISVPSLPGGSDGGGDGGDGGDGGGGDGGGGSSGDIVQTTAEWIYANSPGGVDEEESRCMAEMIAEIVGEDHLAQAGGNLQDLYSGTDSVEATTTEEDDEIRSQIGDCIDSASLEEWRSDGMPW